MKEDVLRQITDVEQQANQIVHNARTQAETILHDARHQAVEARITREEDARNSAKHLIEQGMNEIEQEVAALQQCMQQEIANDAEHANRRRQQTIEFVVTKFGEALRSEK